MARQSATALAAQASNDLIVVFGRLRRLLREVSTADDLTPSQASVLSRLNKGTALTASELAAVEGIREQSMATTLRGLERHQLIERHRDPADGRRQLITLTAAGKDRASGVRQARLDWLASVLPQRCTVEELETVIAAMGVLSRVTEQR